MATKATGATQEAKAIKWKIPPVRVDSDDCEVRIGRVIEDGEITNEGTPWKVHTGEWIEVMPAQSIGEILALTEIMDNTSASLRTICTELSRRVVGWNWTGMDSEPLPQPYMNPKVLEELTDDELMWVMGATKGRETTAERKND